MCGLVGLYLPNEPAGELDLDAMLATIGHRGPDGRHIWRAPDRRYQCGFARLAIIDLATGDQPIVTPDHVVMGNGEIYNYLELRADPAVADWRFKTQGDIEAVLPWYVREGEAFVQRLNGMYGLALYDRARHSLLLVRDRLGIKPLYWARTSAGGIIFASEIKPLLASGQVPAEVDEGAIGAYLAHGYVPAPATLYHGIHKLPPGHLLRAHADGRVEIERYWRPRPASGLPSDAEGVREVLTDLLSDAIRLQLRSDVRIGALLSGGLDSGLIVALAARQLDQPLNTYTVRFEGAANDETALAEMVASRYGTRQTVIDVPATSAGALLPELAWYCDEPLADASLLPNLQIERVLGAEVRVALNGTGGDELFAGYGRYFQLPVEQRYLRLPRALRRGLVEPLTGMGAPMIAWRLARAEKFTGNRGEYLHDHSTFFPPAMRDLIGFRGAVGRPAQADFFAEFDGPAQTGALYAELNTYLPEDLLLLLDRTSMAASVEGRVPFLDHRLVELALAVPPAIRTPGGRQKALERAMAAPLLPKPLLSAPKQGFASPVAAWMHDGLLAPAGRLLKRPRSLQRGWWSAAGIDRLLADPTHHGYRLYSLVMLELCVRLHAEGGSASPVTASLDEIADG